MTTHPLVAELRTLRHVLGVRATDIAAATGISLTSISYWECGRYVPRLEKFVPYAAAIGFDVSLTPAGETAARLPLLTLTDAEIQALADSARAWLDLGDEPTLRAALTKLRPDTTPGRPHRDEPPLTRDVETVHLPAADIA